MTDRKSNSPNGISIKASTRTVILILAALGVGGSGAHFGLKLFNDSGDDENSHISDTEYNARFEVKKIKDVQFTQGKDIKTLKTDVSSIKTDVSSIKDVQIENVASREARRVFKEAKGPKKLDDYDRLLRLNRERLRRKVPAPPCSNKACSN
jgi:hypothetical protein